ncbi:MAG TPA: hypothetical protein VL992_04960 [Tepidisphaeraceae bacterium]|nr:hypothetical protein [Tepidisphaeraceae bacterium]
MTNSTSHGGSKEQPRLTPLTALKLAWICWGVLLIAPYTLLLFLIYFVQAGGAARFAWVCNDTTTWFVALMAYLAIIVPGSFFLRGHLLKDYWLGRPVPPKNYVLATIAGGAALAVGGILSLIGCLLTGSFVPNLIPGALALFLFLIHLPTGRAMIRNSGNQDDPEVYEEPR